MTDPVSGGSGTPTTMPLGSVRPANVRRNPGRQPGFVRMFGAQASCRPHSVLSRPAHRPDRGSSPGATFDVHGMQPMDG